MKAVESTAYENWSQKAQQVVINHVV